MGLCIDGTWEGSYPRWTALTLTCDGCPDRMMRSEQTFEHEGGFIVQYRMAMNAGWKDTRDERGIRNIFGPCCSGKVVSNGKEKD